MPVRIQPPGVRVAGQPGGDDPHGGHPDRRPHALHKKLTEIYLILEGEGYMELDGEMIPVKPLTSILIKPGCRHRAVGKMKIVNIPVPAFDPTDEWFD
jgi:mannose-6-phosphate isomerase-like protein (cupin superfamily)